MDLFCTVQFRHYLFPLWVDRSPDKLKENIMSSSNVNVELLVKNILSAVYASQEVPVPTKVLVNVQPYSFKKGKKVIKTAACNITPFLIREDGYYQKVPGNRSPADVYSIEKEFSVYGAEETCRRYKLLAKQLREDGF